MTKIKITHDLGLSSKDIKRLKSFGKLMMYNSRPNSTDEWLKRVEGANIICSGVSGLKEGYSKLKNVFISLPMVGHAYLDKKILKKNNITVANSPGCNKDAVSEWIIGMIINLFRKMMFFINNENLPNNKAPHTTLGLVDKNILIIGKGNIGIRVGQICKILKMKVSYFKRGDNLIEAIKNQKVIVNCLSANETSKNLLNIDFFSNLENETFFISIAPRETYDKDAMFKALDTGKIKEAAIDEGTMPTGKTDDIYYQKLIKHSKIIATPHIAYNSDYTDTLANKMMIDNIEGWLNGKPINLVK